MSWISVEKIGDDEQFIAGTAFRFFETQEGLNIGHKFPINCNSMDYILLPFDNKAEYMALICLSVGEEGNTTRHLKIEHNLKGDPIVTGQEIKRMLLSNLEKIFVNPTPQYIIDDLPKLPTQL